MATPSRFQDQQYRIRTNTPDDGATFNNPWGDKAARTRLALHAEDACHIAAAEPGDAKGGEQALILTISSMVFRLLLVLPLVLEHDGGEVAVALTVPATGGVSE